MKSRKCFTGVARLAAVLLMVVGVMLAPQAAAAEKFKGINLSPLSADFDLKNGETKSGTLKVSNTTDDVMTVDMSVQGYTIQDDNYGAPRYVESAHSQMASWIKLDADKFTLRTDEARTVKYTITAPANPPAGTQYAMIFASTEFNSSNKESGISSINQIGLRVRANMIDGKTINKVNVTDKQINAFQPDSPLKARFAIKNEGNVGATVKYRMRVTSALGGKEVYKGQEMESGEDVYPGTTKRYSIESDKLGIGFYNVEMTVDLNGKTETFKQLVCSVPIWIFILIAIAIICIVVYFVTRGQDDQKPSKKGSKKSTRKSSKK